MRRAVLVASVLLFLVGGCATGGVRAGTINSAGFVHGHYGYRVNRASASDLISPNWLVRSHYRESDEAWLAKRGPNYETSVSFEGSNDGRTLGSEQELIVDLALSHRQHSGYIWVESVPLPMWSADRDLGVLAHSVLNSYSRGASVSAGWGWLHVDGARYATRVVQSSVVSVDGLPAVHLTFDLANMNDRQLAEGRVQSRVRLVVVRTSAAWMPNARGKVRSPFPMMFVIGYAALPEDFERGAEDFNTFLSNVHWAGDAGALDPSTPAVLACAPGTSEVDVQIEVDSDGDVNAVGPRFASNASSDMRRCLGGALDNVQLTPTGQKRWIIHTFGRVQAPAPQSIPQPEREADVPPPPPPPVPPAPPSEPVAPSQPTPAIDPTNPEPTTPPPSAWR